MKKKKGGLFVLLLALALVTAIAVGTYARYSSTATGTGAATIAKWAVMVNDNDNIVTSPNFAAAIAWDTNENVVNGLLAPGITGTAAIKIDPAGSQVAMDYYVSVDEDTLAGINPNIIVSSVKVGETTLTRVSNGTCSVLEHTTQIACTEAGGTWTPGAHDGEYKGSISLPAANQAMTGAQAVTIDVELEWVDGHPDQVANEADTVTGRDASTTPENIGIVLTVEQKVD